MIVHESALQEIMKKYFSSDGGSGKADLQIILTRENLRIELLFTPEIEYRLSTEQVRLSFVWLDLFRGHGNPRVAAFPAVHRGECSRIETVHEQSIHPVIWGSPHGEDGSLSRIGRPPRGLLAEATPVAVHAHRGTGRVLESMPRELLRVQQASVSEQ